MRNNKGFGKIEIMTVIVMLLVVFAFLFYLILNGTGNQKFETMKENGLSFAKTVTTNIASFHYTNTVYLEETIDEGYLKNIKSPFGGGNCDPTESKIDTVDGKALTTLKCGKYLLDQVDFNDTVNIPFYEVGEWKDTSIDGDNVEEKVLYNCIDNDKEVFDQYTEELNFVYRYNKKFGTDYYFAEGMGDDMCEVVTKTFYRTRKEGESK